MPYGRKVGCNKRHAGTFAALIHEQHGQCIHVGKLATSKSCFVVRTRHCLTLKQEKWLLLGPHTGWLFMLEACSAVTQCIHQKETSDKLRSDAGQAVYG